MSEAKKITIHTIAKQCGVSVSTVSLVINNKPGVRREVREMVKRCVADLGWQSNNIQRKFDQIRQCRQIAFVFNSWQPTCFGGDPLARTLQCSLELFHEQGILPAVYYGHCRDVLQQLQLDPYRVAVLLSNDFCLGPELLQLRKVGTRVLLAHCEWREPIFPRIHSDHYSAGKSAALKLKELGCKSPGFFGGFGNKFHFQKFTEAEPPLDAYFSGIKTVYEQFDVQDAVGEACRDLSELSRMYRSGKYDGWIIQARSFFDSFSFMRESVDGTERKIPLVIFDTAQVPAYPVSKFDCLAENCEKIAAMIYELAMSETEPDPLEYAIPYQWNPPWSACAETEDPEQ